MVRIPSMTPRRADRLESSKYIDTAPMPGMVVTIAVEPGQEVITGQRLVIIESMKMQSEIVAWRDGVVERIYLQVGDTFDRGASLIGLEPEEAEEADA